MKYLKPSAPHYALKMISLVAIILAVSISPALAVNNTPFPFSSNPERWTGLTVDLKTYQVRLSNPTLVWSGQDDGRLSIGDLKFPGEPVKVKMLSGDKLAAGVLEVSIDPVMVAQPKIFVFTKLGELLVQGNLSGNKMLWAGGRAAALDSLANGSKIASTRVISFGLDADALKRAQTEEIRICTYQQSGQSNVMSCSTDFQVNDKANKITLAEGDKKFRMTLNGAEVAREGSLEIKKETNDFIASFPSGCSVTVSTQTKKIEIFSLIVDKDKFWVKAEGERPTQPTFDLTVDRGSLWRATIGDLHEYFEFQVPKSPAVFFVDAGLGMKLAYRINYTGNPLPPTDIKPDPRWRHSTYVNEPFYEGTLDPKFDITSKTKTVNRNGNRFKWIASTATPFAYNYPTITVKTKSKDAAALNESTYRYEIYRGKPLFAALRFGASLDIKGNFVPLVDAQGTYWFERPWGNRYWISDRRWGLSASSTLSSSGGGAYSQFSMNTAESLYRFTPGVDHWDETVGLSASIADFNVAGGGGGQFLGGGLFWMRSLPKWFTTGLGWTGLFALPIWADVRANAYALSVNPALSGFILAVRATGRIEITPSYFFEIGWGVTSATIDDNTRGAELTFNAARGFFGLGGRF